MHLLLVGVSHRTAPVELRERLDFSARGVDRALTTLAESRAHHEATIVSTCNRVELYIGCDETERAPAKDVAVHVRLRCARIERGDAVTPRAKRRRHPTVAAADLEDDGGWRELAQQ